MGNHFLLLLVLVFGLALAIKTPKHILKPIRLVVGSVFATIAYIYLSQAFTNLQIAMLVIVLFIALPTIKWERPVLTFDWLLYKEPKPYKLSGLTSAYTEQIRLLEHRKAARRLTGRS